MDFSFQDIMYFLLILGIIGIWSLVIYLFQTYFPKSKKGYQFGFLKKLAKATNFQIAIPAKEKNYHATLSYVHGTVNNREVRIGNRIFQHVQVFGIYMPCNINHLKFTIYSYNHTGYLHLGNFSRINMHEGMLTEMYDVVGQNKELIQQLLTKSICRFLAQHSQIITGEVYFQNNELIYLEHTYENKNSSAPLTVENYELTMKVLTQLCDLLEKQLKT